MKKFFLVLIFLMCLPTLISCNERSDIKAEIFEYVLQNKDNIELDPNKMYQEFFYRATGDITAGVDYGYYYSEYDKYEVAPSEENRYKSGYRIFGINGDPADWYYTEKICDHWYYYELHDG